MHYLTDKAGRYTPESRSILKIFEKVIFKDNRNMASDVLNSMVHIEKNHGTPFLVGLIKTYKSRIIGRARLPRTTRNGRTNKLLVGLKSLQVVAQLRVCSLVYRWKAKSPKMSTYAKFCKEINQGRTFDKHDAVPPGFKFKPHEIKEYVSYRRGASIKWTPLFASGAHVLENNVVKRGEQNVVDEIFAMTEAGSIFLEHAEYISYIFGLTEAQTLELMNLAEERERAGNTYVGRIAALNKDGALKLRHVANLVKGWQVAISPLVEFYKMIEKNYDQSANWSQLEAATKAAQATKEGFSLSSFDIVSSTDNIPRALFFMLMDPVMAAMPNDRDGILLKNAYEVDKSLCERGVYLTPFNQRAWYDIGQAMGRWTSKSQLNLTNIRLDAACGGNGHNSAINGDDVEIWDDDVSIKYEKLLKSLDIPISIQKSYIRTENGEFSGRIIFRDGGILPVFKGHRINKKDDPLGAVRQYGIDGLLLLTPQERRTLAKVAQYLVFDETGISAETLNMSQADLPGKDETQFLKEKRVALEKGTWPLGFFKQVYVEEPEDLVREKKLLAFTQTFICTMNRGPINPNSFTNNAINKYREETRRIDERLRRLRDYRHAGVKRYRPPNNRLDTLVDNLNAKILVTSDKSTIQGYGDGETARVFERLYQDVPNALLAHSPYDVKSKETGTKKIAYFNRLYRKIRRWERALKEAEKPQVCEKPPTVSLIDRFFAWFLSRPGK